MSTRSSVGNLFPPLDYLELTIRRRSRSDPTLLNNSEMAAEGPGDLPATNFGLKNDMIQQLHNSCQFHGLLATVGNTQNVYAAGAYQVERETEATKDTVYPTNNGSTKDVQPSVVPTKSPILNSKLVISPIIEPVASPVSASKPNLRPSIPYPSRMQDQKLRNKANDQREKFFQIFKDLNFNNSFVGALILIPKFGPTIKTLLTNKDKLSKLARTPLNEHCSAVLLKKLLEKLGDPNKFLIPCDFSGMAECLALADLGVSINLMPLSLWNKISLPDLSLTCMTLELVDRSISHPVGVVEDVFVKVGTFHFSADFVVVDFDADPRVPLILERSFLKTGRALIDVFEEYSQEVLSFSDMIASGNPTPYYDLIVSTTSPTLNPFGNSDLLLEEVDAFLSLDDDPTSPEVDQSYFESKGDILLLEAFLNDDPSPRPPNQGNYLPQVRKKLKIFKAKFDKSSIDEPLEVEIKDLPPHLEYIFQEGDDKLPVIIAKDLSIEEKTALITVLKSHKRAIAWKLFDIKGIAPEFCTHKILMEDDFEPTVQHQRRVNPKIHDVIKNEVLKLLDAGLIYPIFDSPWVSPVHCVPKKGGFIVVENEENELIPTRLVMGWCVCIDYRKLNEATCKDHFPLPFMDQMLERLAGNQYYCFLDGFSGTHRQKRRKLSPTFGTIDNEEEEPIPVYDTDIEDVIEEEEGFVGKGGFSREEDNIEDVVVVANDLCSSMIQTILIVDFEDYINTNPHELMSFGKVLLSRRNRVDPNLLNDFNIATNGNGDHGPPPKGGECYDLIENMTTHHNDWDTSVQRSELSSSITSSFDPKIIALKVEMAKINKNLMKVLQINQQVKAVTLSYETYGGPHSYNDCPATVVHTQNGQNPPPAYQALVYQASIHQALIPQPQVVTTTEFTNYMKANDAILKNMQTNMTSLKNSNLELKNMFGQFMKMNTASFTGSGTLPSNTTTNPKEDLKGITTRSGIACKGPTIPTTSSPPKVVECETEVTKDTVPPINNESNKDDQPLVVEVETQVSNSKPVVEPIKAPISAPKANPKPSILYSSRLNELNLR
nr:reverse transcriptase domain-containing protein [Tanacetum cinerariifolium]